jgi:hypothetical protein
MTAMVVTAVTPMRPATVAEASPTIAVAMEIRPPMHLLKEVATLLRQRCKRGCIRDRRGVSLARRHETYCGGDRNRPEQILHAVSPLIGFF